MDLRLTCTVLALLLFMIAAIIQSKHEKRRRHVLKGRASASPELSVWDDDEYVVPDLGVSWYPADALRGINLSSTKRLTRGAWRDGTYTNEYASVAFRLPTGWKYSSDIDIAELMNLSADTIGKAGGPASKKMLEQQSIYDMVSESRVTESNVALLYDNLNMIDGALDFSADAYLEAVRDQLQTIDPELEYTFADSLRGYTMRDKSYKVLCTLMRQEGVQQYYLARRIENYMMTIIISVAEGDNLADILSHFS